MHQAGLRSARLRIGDSRGSIASYRKRAGGCDGGLACVGAAVRPLRQCARSIARTALARALPVLPGRWHEICARRLPIGRAGCARRGSQPPPRLVQPSGQCAWRGDPVVDASRCLCAIGKLGCRAPDSVSKTGALRFRRRCRIAGAPHSARMPVGKRALSEKAGSRDGRSALSTAARAAAEGVRRLAEMPVPFFLDKLGDRCTDFVNASTTLLTQG